MDSGWDALLKHVPRSTNTNKLLDNWDALAQFLPSVPPASQQQDDWESLLAFLPPSVGRSKSGPKNSIHGQTFYHGTSAVCLEVIKVTRLLEASSSGQLGRGVYVTPVLSKAENFARDAPNRGKGFGSVVLEVIVTAVRVKVKQNSSQLKPNWQLTYDAAKVNTTNASARPELCVKEPNNVRIVRWKYLGGPWNSF